MLRELRNVRQVSGEARRRWFFCHDLDLIVWEDTDGSLLGFQLAYDKQGTEHSFAWRKDQGFSHYVVDDGEPMAGVNDTPFLYANGPFSRDRVLGLFLALSPEIPSAIASFVATKLREFDGPLLR